jgi:hypothetical protein
MAASVRCFAELADVPHGDDRLVELRRGNLGGVDAFFSASKPAAIGGRRRGASTSCAHDDYLSGPTSR